MREEEHNIQCACVRWFNLQWPEYRGLLFAVPNGGARSKATAGKLKAEGVVPGVADLILLVPKRSSDNPLILAPTYCGICIEMKTQKGRQSPEQIRWMERVAANGYKYAVCHSLEDFMAVVNEYLK